MAGALRKMGLYLGIVEDDEAYDEEYDPYEVDEQPARREPLRAGAAPSPARPLDDRGGRLAVDHYRVTTVPRAAEAAEPTYRITTLHPRTYNEARTIGENFRDGTPVIINLTEMDDGDAKRLVDFAAGLIFGLRGSIERITNKVFLLSPANVDVTAEDKARIAEGGFFNQS
ncbi:MAG: cell division protein SepF [Frankiaceae bacterium]